eukprot:807787-Rhodomonas_salina.1
MWQAARSAPALRLGAPRMGRDADVSAVSTGRCWNGRGRVCIAERKFTRCVSLHPTLDGLVDLDPAGRTCL